MKKKEIQAIHIMLSVIKKYLEENCYACDFSEYNELDISPYQVHRTNKEHKQAVFLLAETIATLWKKQMLGYPTKKIIQGYYSLIYLPNRWIK